VRGNHTLRRMRTRLISSYKILKAKYRDPTLKPLGALAATAIIRKKVFSGSSFFFRPLVLSPQYTVSSTNIIWKFLKRIPASLARGAPEIKPVSAETRGPALQELLQLQRPLCVGHIMPVSGG
jgi:hypothetical protein